MGTARHLVNEGWELETTGRSLSRKIVIAILSASALITSMSAALSFYWDYRLEVSTLEKTLRQIEKSSIEGLAQSLYNFDIPQVNTLMKGIRSLQDITRVRVENINGDVYEEKSENNEKYLLERRYELVFRDGGEDIPVGSLLIEATRQNLIERLLSKLWLFIGSQAAKTLAMAAVMYAIINWIVIRRVQAIKRFFDCGWFANADADKRTLHLVQRGPADELDALAESINVMSSENLEYQRREVQRVQMEKDLETARAVQATLLPARDRFGGFQVAAHYRPAEKAGGDWYFLHEDPIHHRVFVVIGDATGHGVPAALVTAVVAGAVQAVLAEASDEEPLQLLRRLARCSSVALKSTGAQSERGMTANFVCIDELTGNGILLNCGHVHPYLISSGGSRLLISRGAPLGGASERFGVSEFVLRPNDALFLYTDGLIENQGPEGGRLTQRSLGRILEEKISSGADACLAALLAESQRLGCEHSPADDCTALLMQWAFAAPCERLAG